MSDFRELYQEVILDHARHPRNQRELADARHADGFNPLCGDRVTVYARVEGDVVKEVAFRGTGCAISQASASVMTEVLAGHTVAEVEQLFERFHDVVTGAEEEPDAETLGKLAVFAGVKDYPARVKCASLAWHALRNALHAEGTVASTEGEDRAGSSASEEKRP